MTLIKEFKATPTKCLFNSDSFKIYACTIDSLTYPQIKVGKYGTITIKGDIQELNCDCEYIIRASETTDKYGVSYKILNIRSEKPKTLNKVRDFLSEIITDNQTEALLSVYPDIVDRVLNESPVDLSKIKGIKEYTFNIIKTKIIENFKLAELVEEFSGLFSFSIIKKLYTEYTSIEKVRESLYNNPYECLCSLGGIGFKTADEILLKINKLSQEQISKKETSVIDFGFNLETSLQRMKACCLYVLNENENKGHTYMSIKNFQKECSSLVPEAKHHLAGAINLSDDIIFIKEYGRISKTSTFETEKFISDKLITANNNSSVWNIDIEKYRNIGNSSLTDEQMLTLKYVCQNTVTILQGFAGAGKSFSIITLINLLKDNGKSSILLAPTGRAAKVLQKYTNHTASTIHRGLGHRPPQDWMYNEENKLPFDIVILDETSMTDVFLFKKLLAAIDFTKTKLLLIGDNAQIPSVSCGNLLHDLLNSKVIPTVWLTKVFRYGKGGLSTMATDIRNGQSTLEQKAGIQVIGEDNGFNFVPVSPEKSTDYIIKIYQKLLSENVSLKDILIVMAQNKGKYGTQAVNNIIQEVINPNADKSIKYGDVEYRIGDPVIQCCNDYKSIIYNGNDNYDEKDTTLITNGEIGIVSDVMWNGIVVDFDDYKILITKDKMANIKLAYAISIHKCQGGQAKYVIVSAPNSHLFMLNSNLLYVGVTRAKEKCYYLGDLKTYNIAIKKKENFTRQTWLCDLLKENKNNG